MTKRIRMTRTKGTKEQPLVGITWSSGAQKLFDGRKWTAWNEALRWVAASTPEVVFALPERQDGLVSMAFYVNADAPSQAGEVWAECEGSAK